MTNFEKWKENLTPMDLVSSYDCCTVFTCDESCPAWFTDPPNMGEEVPLACSYCWLYWCHKEVEEE